MRYRQITQKLRLQYGPGKPDVVSERPRHEASGRYLDNGETYVELTGEEVGVDVAMLLAIGAIEPLPEPKRATAKKGDADG